MYVRIRTYVFINTHYIYITITQDICIPDRKRHLSSHVDARLPLYLKKQCLNQPQRIFMRGRVVPNHYLSSLWPRAIRHYCYGSDDVTTNT